MEFKEIKNQFNNLPQSAQKVVEDFVEFLAQKYSEKKVKAKKTVAKQKLGMKWAGALSDLKSKYTSVQLQHEISKKLW